MVDTANMAKFPGITEAAIGTQEDKLRRDLLIFACAFMNLAVVLWLAIYWVMGLHFPANIPRERFIIDPSLEHARYVVIDRIWRNWAALALPDVAKMITQVEGWPLVMKDGEFEVYRNPAR